MREEFHGWYPKDAETLKRIWRDALFVPDANILLHCLRHQAHVRERLLDILTKLGSALWIPYQVGLEFQRNRLSVEAAALDAYDQLQTEMRKIVTQGTERLRQLRAHPMIDQDAEIAELEKYLEGFVARLKAMRDSHPDQDVAQAVDRLGDIFKGRIGEPWPQDRLAALRKEGEDRYTRKIPPGYMDERKDADPYARYGDLIIWKEMIAKAKADGRPVIFISDDAKEDWWRMHRGRRLSVRPELVEEFMTEAGQDFHMYELKLFLRMAAEQRTDIEQATVELVEKSLEEDEHARRAIETSAEHQSVKRRLLELEGERTELITHLTGVPVLGETREIEAMDRPTLRAHLARLQDEIAGLSFELRRLEGDGERPSPAE